MLVQVARNAGIIGSEIYNATLAASLITILINAALVRYTPAAMARWVSEADISVPEELHNRGYAGHVVICGFGRVGSAIGFALETFGVRYSVVEIDPDVFEMLRARGILSIFGDCAIAIFSNAPGFEELPC